MSTTLSKEYVDEYMKNRWLNLGNTRDIVTTNPFANRTDYEIENPHIFLLDYMRKPENFGFTCEVLFNKTLAPFQIAMLQELWTKPFVALIGTRGFGKSFLLAVYAMLRALFTQGSKIIVIGAAFRQSKVIFDYCHELWENGPIYRDIVGEERKNSNGPRRDIDRCYLTVGQSIIIAIPVGSGEKIRGQRATITICDEFSSISRPVFETVIRGFASVSMNPVEQYRLEMEKEAMKELGIWAGDVAETNNRLKSNQTILSGTAYYSFNHFFDYWKQYKAIVESKGDPKKVAEIFNGDVPVGFNWKDYCVIRMPVHMLPPRFMDEKQIAQAKATIHSGIYLNEYAACHHPDTLIMTDRGIKIISNILVGDKVLTHMGRFRKVTGVTKRPYSGPVVEWKTYGCNKVTQTTLDHKFWTGTEWEPLGGLTHRTYVPRLRELSGQVKLDITSVVTDWREVDNMIYPIWPKKGKKVWTNEEIAYIRETNETQKYLAKKYGVAKTQIQYLQARRRPKHLIPKTIKLDYYFGLILGYYASEGAVGARGRAIAFSLDGHCVARLEEYVEQLSDALHRVFGLEVKEYRHEDNTVSVTVNSRLVAELISSICPGVSHTKRLDPSILYSNPELLRGFLIGYWNGDGHWSTERDYVSARCVNKNLLIQIKNAFSYFGIVCGYRSVKKTQESVFRGKVYNSRPTWELYANGDNGRKLKMDFYGCYSGPSGIQPFIYEENDGIAFRFKHKEIVEYEEPFVYNLEVEEDHSYSLPNACVHNCFSDDSNGFYKRSLIESCVVGKPGLPVRTLSCGEVTFNAVLRGDPNRRYVMAVDPASEQDNFSIVILECWEDHRRIVHCWTTTRSRYKAKLQAGLVEEGDFYAYTSRKIRELCQKFNVERIGIDSQGGGVAVIEALQDPDKLRGGEVPFLPVINPDEPKETDGRTGQHILEIINFAKAEWVRDANHGMRKDFEDKALLFPCFDEAVLGLSYEEDKMSGRIKMDLVNNSEEKLYDTLEDCFLEIEDLKDELATIVHSQTGTAMRDRWDTPETKLPGGKKGRMRKDRYSSLLMANMIGRTLQRQAKEEEYESAGGFAKAINSEEKKDTGDKMWIGWRNSAKGNLGLLWAERCKQEGVIGGQVVRRGVNS